MSVLNNIGDDEVDARLREAYGIEPADELPDPDALHRCHAAMAKQASTWFLEDGIFSLPESPQAT